MRVLLHEAMSTRVQKITGCTLQDINSQSWMVRMYYKHRLFMGACCISCEVLYLSVSPDAAAQLANVQAKPAASRRFARHTDKLHRWGAH